MKVSPLGSVSPAAYPSDLAPIRRQPIFGADFEIYGYEFFFGSGQEAVPVADGYLSPRVMGLVREALKGMTGPHRAFINLTEESILARCCEELPKDQVVLEVLEDVSPEPAVIRELTRLSRQGYRIALDDFVYADRQVPLVHLADIVKVDVLSTNRSQLGNLIATLRPYDVNLLAEKIETREDLDHCLELGFDYYQGYFLSPPQGACAPTDTGPGV